MATLIIFARAPVAGQVKTRLARTVGEAAALALYEAFLEDVAQMTQGLGARRVLAVAGELDHAAITRLAKSQRLTVEPQGDGDLGARMAAAIERHVAHGPVVIIGSDAPTVPRASLHRALDALVDRDVVIGPAADGGYWLIGVRLALPGLFTHIAWSTPSVLPETLARLGERAHLILPEHYDVDDAADLARLRSELSTLPATVAPATRRVLAALPGI
jgi:rSAM/selenodomain-associated transferase 1